MADCFSNGLKDIFLDVSGSFKPLHCLLVCMAVRSGLLLTLVQSGLFLILKLAFFVAVA